MTITTQQNRQEIAILDNNFYSCYALKSIFHEIKFADGILLYNDVHELIEALSKPNSICKVILTFDIVNFNTFFVLDFLMDYYPAIDIIVIICSPNNKIVSLILSMNVKIILSDNDKVCCFYDVILFRVGNYFLSPEISKIHISKNYRIAFFTKTERFVLNCLLMGETPALIAATKNVSVKKISSHKLRAFKKIKISRLSELYSHH